MHPPIPIGVVIPTYNREATIDRAVESVFAQTRRAERIVVVDDGSTDGTLDRLRRYGDAIHVLAQENSGASIARNNGVAALDSRWVAFLDSDDFWVEDHLERMSAAIAATGGAADVYFSDTEVLVEGERSTFWQAAGFSIEEPYRLVDDGTDWVLLALQPTMLQSSVIRRSRYLEVGGLWHALDCRHDTHLFFVLGFGRPICAVAGVGAVMTADADSDGRLTVISAANTRGYAEQTVTMYDDLLARYPALPPGPRDELRTRLVDGHVREAALAFKGGDRGKGLRSLSRALRTSPTRVAYLSLRAVRNRLPGGNARVQPG